MQYQPEYQTVSNKPYAPAQGVSTDARSYFYDKPKFVTRPYQDKSEVTTYLYLQKYRIGHFPIFINIGGVLNEDGTFTGGRIVEHWFKDGTEDTDLIVKDNNSFFTGPASLIVPAGHLLEVILVKEATDIVINVGTTLGGAEILAAYPLTGFVPITVSYPCESETTVYFSGITPNTQIKLLSR